MINKTIIARIVLILAGSTFISGCAPMISGAMNATLDENTVFEKTAKYFGVTRKDITISAIDKGALATSYQVRYAGNFYNCSIYYGAVDCKQPGGQNSQGNSKATGQLTAPAAQVASVVPAMTPTQAQARLNQLGYPVGAPDGVFGKKSVQQLKSFQQAKGLPVNGKLDDATVAALQ